MYFFINARQIIVYKQENESEKTINYKDLYPSFVADLSIKEKKNY
jgi:hypothetical protein